MKQRGKQGQTFSLKWSRVRKYRHRNRTVGILLVIVFIFIFVWSRKNSEQSVPPIIERQNSTKIENWEQEFLEKNKENIIRLEEIQFKLLAEMPTLGVTGEEFNHGLQSIIDVLAKCPAENYEENWQIFQENFAYAYEEWNKKTKQLKKLPKDIQINQEKIRNVLQDLNRVIQSMNK